MMVAFDIGNSNFHFGTTVDGLLRTESINNVIRRHTDAPITDPRAVADLVSLVHGIRPKSASPVAWCGISVAPQATEELQKTIQSHYPGDSFQTIGRTQIPLNNDLLNAETVGIDRLLTGWFASQIARPPIIAVDAGSAVTIDWVDQNHVFRGGMIFPGARLAAGSLHRQTAALPAVELDAPLAIIQQVYGRDTQSAIQTGILWSQWGAICHSVRRLQEFSQDQAQVIVTGGGMMAFQSLLPADWHHEPHLNLKAVMAWFQRRDGSD